MDEAQIVQRHAATVFLHAFFANEYPSSHVITGAEADYLRSELSELGIDRVVIEAGILAFNEDPNFGHQRRGSAGARIRQMLFQSAGTNEQQNLRNITQLIDGQETVADDESDFSWRERVGAGNHEQEGHNMLNLVYRIAEDQARKDGYIHRGIECNSCGTCPIQGIRYRCANCQDFDLCESCEAMQVHIKTHVFYKVRIPAPSLGNSRQSMPVWYPGKPASLPRSLPRHLAKRLLRETGLDNAEMEALWEQFRCLAGCSWANDPNKLGMAIDRPIFDKCFVPPSALRPPPPNLIYDRMFAFYDTNHDGFIGFEEFLKGLANFHDKTREAKLKRTFQGYDMDNDGYVDRKDFLRMFRAYYSSCKEINREVVAGMEEDLIEGGIREVIQGSQPISSAFPGIIPPGHTSREGVGKILGPSGDLEIVDNGGVLQQDSDDRRNRHEAIADAAVSHYPRGHPFRTFSAQPATDAPLVTLPGEVGPMTIHHQDDLSESENLDEPSFQIYGWPPLNRVEPEDIQTALGRAIPFEEVMDPVDRSRVFVAQSERLDAEGQRNMNADRTEAVRDRWRRRAFYTDVEEGATRPPGYTEADSSDDDENHVVDVVDALGSPASADSRAPSRRSRSSSKVRFEDDITDTDYETRSNTSSRSIPVGERWGGWEISEAEKEVGKEILFQAVQQGFNEMLDPLFKEKEDLAMETMKSRAEREKWADEIKAYEGLLAMSDVVPTKYEPNGVSRSTPSADAHQTRAMTCMPLSEDIDFGAEELSGASTPSEQAIVDGLATNLSKPSVEDAAGQKIEQNSPLAPNPSPPPDPTLPQNRPDCVVPSIDQPVMETGSTLSFNNTSTTSPVDQPGSLNNASSLPVPLARPMSSSPTFIARRCANGVEAAKGPPPSSLTLAVWLEHQNYEQEVEQRGGMGRLSYDEFTEKMVDGNKGDAGEDKGAKKWGGSSSIGKLWFVGTWIEMASF